MSTTLEIGHEQYTIDQGVVSANDPEDKAQVARARFLTSVGPAWVEQARQSGYDPYPDCTLAKVIADHVKGRYTCPPSGNRRGVVY